MNETKMGYAFAAAGGVLYVLCTALFAIAPEFYASVWSSAFHVATVSIRSFDFSVAIVGFVVMVVAAFITGYVFAWAFNYFKPGK